MTDKEARAVINSPAIPASIFARPGLEAAILSFLALNIGGVVVIFEELVKHLTKFVSFPGRLSCIQ